MGLHLFVKHPDMSVKIFSSKLNNINYINILLYLERKINNSNLNKLQSQFVLKLDFWKTQCNMKLAQIGTQISVIHIYKLKANLCTYSCIICNSKGLITKFKQRQSAIWWLFSKNVGSKYCKWYLTQLILRDKLSASLAY